MLQLVFVVLTGEAWGYLGSRRFLLESAQQSDTIKGLDLSMIESVFLLEPVHYRLIMGYMQFQNIFYWLAAYVIQLWYGTLVNFMELLEPEIMSYFRTINESVL